MKEAYGGTFMLYIFMIFFVIFVSIIGVALNFAKIYRIKNNVINILEQYQYKMGVVLDEGIENELNSYLNNVPYNINQEEIDINSDCLKRANNNAGNYDANLAGNYGICVVKKGDESRPYYSVTVYYYMVKLPVIEIPIKITASGETISY